MRKRKWEIIGELPADGYRSISRQLVVPQSERFLLIWCPLLLSVMANLKPFFRNILQQHETSTGEFIAILGISNLIEGMEVGPDRELRQSEKGSRQRQNRNE